jgi:hypothetical protein
MSATAIILLCALACPLSMALMMLFMRRNHDGSRATEERDKEKLRDRDAG